MAATSTVSPVMAEFGGWMLERARPGVWENPSKLDVVGAGGGGGR